MNTPGPWFVVGSFDDCDPLHYAGHEHLCISRYEDDMADAMAFISDDGTNEEREANAKLMAAAPELLEACRFVLTTLSLEDHKFPESKRLLTEAIAKATK